MGCQKCKREFKEVSPHVSVVKRRLALIVLCRDCWKSSTPDERVSYYRKLYEFWLEQRVTPSQTWNQIETFVRNDSTLSEVELIKKTLQFVRRLEK